MIPLDHVCALYCEALAAGHRSTPGLLGLILSGISEFPGATASSTGMLGLFRRPMQLSECPFSLHVRSGEQVPSPTARIARASNPDGTTVTWVRDRLDGLWHDQDFACVLRPLREPSSVLPGPGGSVS